MQLNFKAWYEFQWWKVKFCIERDKNSLAACWVIGIRYTVHFTAVIRDKLFLLVQQVVQ